MENLLTHEEFINKYLDVNNVSISNLRNYVYNHCKECLFHTGEKSIRNKPIVRLKEDLLYSHIKNSHTIMSSYLLEINTQKSNVIQFIPKNIEVRETQSILPNNKTVEEFMKLFFPNINESDKFIIAKLLEDKIALQERVAIMYREMEERLTGYKEMVENLIKNTNKKEIV